MIIFPNNKSKQFGQLVETKYGYIVSGQYYKKSTLAPVPLKFCDIEFNKNLFLTQNYFTTCRFSGDNLFADMHTSIIYDNKDENIFYLFTVAKSTVDNSTYYDGTVFTTKVYKIYETESEFRIIGFKDLGNSYRNDDYSAFRYITQDDTYLYGITPSNTSYTITNRNSQINKVTLEVTNTNLGEASQIIYEDENYMYTFSGLTINSLRTAKIEKNTTKIISQISTVKTDESETSIYRYNNDGSTEDDTFANRSNSKTIHNYYTTFAQSDYIKKHNGVFKSETDIETYRVIIGAEGIKEDGSVNIVKFKHNIETLTTSDSTMPEPTVITCEITNKSDPKFKAWRSKMATLNSYYFSVKSMKFANNEHTYLVLDTHLVGALCSSAGSVDNQFSKNNIAVFKIDSSDSKRLTFISEFIEPDVAHKGLIPIPNDKYILLTTGNFIFLSFDYDTGSFITLGKKDKGSGFFGISADNTLFMHKSNGYLDRTKLTDSGYNINLSLEEEPIYNGEDKDINLIVSCKDFLGNNCNSEIELTIVGTDIKFKDTEDKVKIINITNIEDNKKVPLTLTGPEPSYVKYRLIER